jgi:hypothetical protein
MKLRREIDIIGKLLISGYDAASDKGKRRKSVQEKRGRKKEKKTQKERITFHENCK